MAIGDNKFWRTFAAGFLWGILFAFLFGVIYLRHALVCEVRSGVGDYQATIAALAARIKQEPGCVASIGAGCAIPRIVDGSRIEQIKLCHREHAADLLGNENSRKVAAFIPCTFAVYEKSDGQVYVSRLNVKLLGVLLGGVPGRTFPMQVDPLQRAILKDIAK